MKASSELYSTAFTSGGPVAAFNAIAHQNPDARITLHGSIAMLKPLTNAACLWVAQNLALERWQLLGDSIAIDPRHVADIAEIMKADGLEIY